MAVDDQYTVSLLHFDGDLKDESGKVWTAKGGAAVSSTKSKFGGSSLFLDYTKSQSISTPASTDFNFGSGDFTIDWWEYRPQTRDGGCVICSNGKASFQPWVIMSWYGKIRFYMSSNNVAWDYVIDIGSEILNTWVHRALVRQGDYIYAFENGIKKVSTNIGASTQFGTATNPSIGVYADTNCYSGYIDELRISRIARWTTDFPTPTPPSSIPTNLTATAGDAQVSLSWTAVADASGYNVKRASTAGGPYTAIAINLANNNYVDNTVVNGTTYYYVVTAVIASTESANSNEASATPTALPIPSGQAILRVIMSDSSEREYKLSMNEINGFISWFGREIGTGTTVYVLNKVLTNSKEYLAFDKIISFEVTPIPE